MQLLSKQFENNLEKNIYKTNQKYLKFLIDPEEVCNAI